MLRYFILTIILAVIAISIGCEGNQKEPKAEPAEFSEVDLSNGFNLLETNCFSCHSPRGPHEARVAPPMVMIKKHYIDEETSLEEFTEELIAFVSNPTMENARMKGAIRNFGLMPKMEFSERDLRDIAGYIYKTELEAPTWFANHYENEKKRHQKRRRKGQTDYLEEGKQFAMQTKAQLGKNLMAAINSSGSEGAVEFCNTRAYPLTDSMATVLGAKIKRVSDQPRNPNNIANQEELDYIRRAKELLAKGESPKPEIHDKGEMAIGYYPITTNTMCLQCHGTPDKEINQATLDVLDALYPEDQAKGYGENELRGIWVVEMEKKSNQTDHHHVKSKGKRS